MTEYMQLVAAFKELMEVGDKDQWKLAEIAYLASAEHGGITQFAKDTGYAVDTIRRYIGAYKWSQDNETMVSDHSFADVLVLSNMSEDRAAAV